MGLYLISPYRISIKIFRTKNFSITHYPLSIPFSPTTIMLIVFFFLFPKQICATSQKFDYAILIFTMRLLHIRSISVG